MPKKIHVFIILLLTMISVFAQEDIEKLFLRKAVKDYVAKDYNSAVSNLQQVLVANSENMKAQKLIVKCYNNLGLSALESGDGIGSKSYFNKVLKYEKENSTALEGLQQANVIIAQKSASKTTPEQVKSFVEPATIVQPVTPQVVVTQAPVSKTDSVQAKVISNLFENFSAQQKLFEKQIEASNKVMVNTEDSKEKYLEALMVTAEKNNEMMKNYLLVGAAVAGGVLLLVVIVFLIIIFFVNRASNLRTVQANETLQLLLTAPGNESASPKLMLTGPSGQEQQTVQTHTSVSVESLTNEDPIQRANAVEAIAAEIVDEKEDARVEKIKKLEELLNDENNRVRANAAKAIYEIDKKLSLNTLQGMIDNESKRMRASAVWALGEIASEEALKMILSLKEEDDEIVKFNIKVALGKIKSLNRFPISSDMGQEIEAVLENYKDMV